MDKTFVPIRTDVVLQNETAQLYRSYQDFLQFEHLYSSAVREIQTRLEVLNEEFSVRYDHNPIHHVESRLKSTGSIIEKLRRKGLEISMESAKKNINDIAGIRVVCCYIDDVYRVEEMLLRQSDMELVKRQDYIETPNYNGYRSLHLDLRVPIYLSDRTESVLVEVQLRTVAMDFWATIEHSLQYKYKANIPDHIRERLSAAAKAIIVLDNEMSSVRSEIMDAQNSSQMQSNLVKDILINIENLYKIANKREIMKIQDEFLRVFKTKDLQQLKRFHRQLDIISEGYRAQAVYHH